MNQLQRAADVLTRVLDGVIVLSFTVILVLTILQVVLRYLFNAALLGGNEAMEGLFIYTTALGAAVAIHRRRHISISYLVDKLPRLMQRISTVTVHLLIVFLNVVMIYYSIRWIGAVGGNESPVLRVPEWLFQASIPIGCGFVVVYCLVMIALAVGGREERTRERPW